MSTSEIVFGILLVVGLLALSVYFGRQQFQALSRLRTETGASEEERLYERRKAIRRLVSCGLTVLMAVLLASLLACYDGTLGHVHRERAANPDAPVTPEQRFLFRVWGSIGISLLLVLLVVLILAALDLWATRRFALGQYRKIAGDRRAMIQRQVNRIRQERNGHPG